MDFLLEALTNWLKEMLVGGIMSNLSGMFDSVNQQVADISVQVGQTPQGWNGSIFNMIENLSNSIMVPIAGVILAIVMTVDLIQMIADKNNLHDVDTWMIFKWVFKSAAAILIVTNTWNIVMGVFDMAQSVVAQAAGIINSDASIDISSVMTDLEPRLMEMDLGPLFGLWFQSLFIGITMWALYICIFIVIYGRMIEIYLVTSVAPVPMAAMMGKEWGGMGQNYLRSLLALGFQAFLIIVCVAIYAVLVQNIALEDDIIMAMGNKPLLFGGGSPDTSGSEDLSGVQFINGTRPGNPQLVELAKRQVGNVGGYPYWSWYGFDSRVEWCACFVSWCYNQAGKSEPRFAGCEWQGVPWFQSHGQWGARGYNNLAPGDAIFFDWDLDGTADHVGIVIGTDGSRVYTVEGNSGDACKIKSYDLNYQSIKGYGLMNW